AAVGARRLGAEGLGLLLQEGAEGALGQTGHRGGGDLLQRLEDDDAAGACRREGATGDDFSPLGRQLTDFLDLVSRDSAPRQRQDDPAGRHLLPRAAHVALQPGAPRPGLPYLAEDDRSAGRVGGIWGERWAGRAGGRACAGSPADVPLPPRSFPWIGPRAP